MIDGPSRRLRIDGIAGLLLAFGIFFASSVSAIVMRDDVGEMFLTAMVLTGNDESSDKLARAGLPGSLHLGRVMAAKTYVIIILLEPGTLSSDK